MNPEFIYCCCLISLPCAFTPVPQSFRDVPIREDAVSQSRLPHVFRNAFRLFLFHFQYRFPYTSGFPEGPSGLPSKYRFPVNTPLLLSHNFPDCQEPNYDHIPPASFNGS